MEESVFFVGHGCLPQLWRPLDGLLQNTRKYRSHGLALYVFKIVAEIPRRKTFKEFRAIDIRKIYIMSMFRATLICFQLNHRNVFYIEQILEIQVQFNADIFNLTKLYNNNL